MATYSTPGVYVEEITKFPPSVAQVETAIPAFIGYTEIAKKKADKDLNLVPTRITSLLEYETYFGGPEKETAITASVDVNGNVTSKIDATKRSPYLMYYSLQMYFANGGGPCYITSVGQYKGATLTVTGSTLKKGLDEIRRMDEPTLLLFPDATSMAKASHADYYSLCNDALTQCNELQDRFAIFDTFRDEEYSVGSDDFDPIDEFRNKISSEKDYAKYGAAYFPFLETILDYSYDESKVTVTYSDGVDLGLWADGISKGISTANLASSLTSLIANRTTPGTFTAYRKAVLENLTTTKAALNDIKTKLQSIVNIGEDDPSTLGAAGDISTWIDGPLELVFDAIKANQDGLKALTSAGDGVAGISALVDGDIYTDIYGYAAGAATTATLITTTILGATGVIDVELAALLSGLDALDPTAATTVGLDSIAETDNLLYNQIKLGISQIPIYLPPSSTVAGVYARIDKNNGVWKAPANVGLNYVIKPTVNVSHDEQASMNVHTTGKSVNAIRTFTGKGILVWGARTLAGNDNEWRYVPVRRFFNMVEESVKKASEQFVFEGNDANTWVRIRAMIENFLNLQWRAGALTGAKPEQGYYVRVGLGQTMTAEDILNGYLNIEIGMAVVRPAEFIVLKFSHKMQEA